MNAYDILDHIEPAAAVGNKSEGLDDPALGLAIAASVAISLKRIADAFEQFDAANFRNSLLDIAYQAGRNFRGQG